MHSEMLAHVTSYHTIPPPHTVKTNDTKCTVDLSLLINAVVNPQDGRVLDRASEQLGKVRGQRRDNVQFLRQSMNEWARKLAAQNVSEEALVVIRRDRLCVPVKAGRQV